MIDYDYDLYGLVTTTLSLGAWRDTDTKQCSFDS